MNRPDDDLATLLSETREREGWSKRELAARLGIARATVREIEDGRDARWSTLRALATKLPGFFPPALLPTTDPRVPPRSTPAWRRQGQLLGASAHELIRSVRRNADGTLAVEERVLGARRHGPRSAGSVEDLLHRLHQGPRGALMKALASGPPAEGEQLDFDLDGRSWSYRIHGSARSPRVDARLRWTLPAPANDLEPIEAARACGLWLAPEICVERLQLRLSDAPQGSCGEALLQPRALIQDVSSARDWTRAHHAAGATAVSHGEDGALVADFVRPLVGLACALVSVDSALPEDRPRPAPLASGPGALRHARQATGLSARELGRRAGVSAQTLSGAEDGRTDARRSSLLALLEALPDLSPWALLPWPAATPDALSLHELQRQLFGCEVEEEHKEVELSRSGNLRIRIHFRGLRRLRSGGGDLVLLLGAARSVLQERAADLDSLSEDDAEPKGLRISRRSNASGPDRFLLRVPAAVAGRTVSFSRRFVNPGSHVMNAERAKELTGQEGPFHEGTSFGSIVPARRSVLTVKFPRGYRPHDLRATAWAMAQIPDPEGSDLSERLGPAAPRLEWD